MRARLWNIWGPVLLAGLTLQVRARAADDNSNEPPLQPRRTDQGHLLAGWFNTSKKPTEAHSAKHKPATEAANPMERGAKLRAREQDALLRRLDVCDQLRAIASRKGDDALMRRADDLAERVWQIYTKRVERLQSTASSKQLHDLQIETDTADTSAPTKGLVQDRNAGPSATETKP